MLRAPESLLLQLPEDFICPLCKHPASDFEKVIKSKGDNTMATNKYAGTKTEKNLWEAFAGESQARKSTRILHR